MASKQKSAKIKKKGWYPIHAPKLFNDALLGETIVQTPESILGKRVEQNLMNLTNDFKKQNIKITFEVDNVAENKGHTQIVKYQVIPASVKRLVRRRGDRLDLSFLCETKDGYKVCVKPLILTRSYTTTVVKTKLRQTLLVQLHDLIKTMTYDELVSDLVNHKLQNQLKGQVKKIYPVKVCEIRVMEKQAAEAAA